MKAITKLTKCISSLATLIWHTGQNLSCGVFCWYLPFLIGSGKVLDLNLAKAKDHD